VTVLANKVRFFLIEGKNSFDLNYWWI